MFPTGGRLVLRDRRLTAGAVLALAATLTFGCARPIDLANSGSPDSELAALVDSDVRSRRRLEALRLPESVLVLNVVAVPVSGSVGYQVYAGYQMLTDHGPNDGVVLIADTVWPGGVNIVALGADHLFARWREDVYILAMLRALDVAIRAHNPKPNPTTTASES